MSGDEMSRQDVINFIMDRLDVALRNIDQVIDSTIDPADEYKLFKAIDCLLELKNCCNDDDEE
jgi:flagellin-specific chaperone FliS